MLNQSRFNKRKFLEEFQLEERFEICPFCLSKNYEKIEIIQSDPDINVCSCNNCFLGFVDRQPTDDLLKEYYTNYYGNSNEHVTMDDTKLSKHIYKKIGFLTQKERFYILDFGGGNGIIGNKIGEKLLEKKTAKEVTVIVVDLNDDIIHGSNSKIEVIKVHSLSTISVGITFDLIIASAVLEHIKDPRNTSLKLLQLMNNNGKLYIRTPYIYPMFKLLKKFNITIDTLFPGHLFDMGNKFWKTYLKILGLSNGFTIIKSNTSLVETSFKENFTKALVSYIFKLPSIAIRYNYHLVGGWEIVVQRIEINR